MQIHLWQGECSYATFHKTTAYVLSAVPSSQEGRIPKCRWPLCELLTIANGETPDLWFRFVSRLECFREGIFGAVGGFEAALLTCEEAVRMLLPSGHRGGVLQRFSGASS